MNAFPLKSLRRSIHIILAFAFVLSSQVLLVSPVSAHFSSTVVIVDTLGAATPATQFQLAGAGGQSVSSYQQVGPMFVLTRPTEITEIGAFVTYCELLGGVTECPSTRPIVVQIRRSVNGQPDLSKVVGTFVLSNRHPKVFSYQTAHPHLVLKPGTYFAIFAARKDGSANLLSSASDPFAYQAGTTTLGFIFQPEGRTGTGQLSLAVRILGKPKQR